MKYALLLVLVFSQLLVSAFGQADKIDSKVLSKVVKKDGWNIPKIMEEDLHSTETVSIKDTLATAKTYKLKKGIDCQLDFYFLDASNTLITFAKDVEARAIGSFNINGKVFAYAINYVPIAITENSSKAFAGILISVYYFDEDGDGKFETRYIDTKFPDIIPDWVIKANTP